MLQKPMRNPFFLLAKWHTVYAAIPFRHGSWTPTLLIMFMSIVHPGYTQAQALHQDWDFYEAWQSTTQYQKTYIVNQRHPDASDTNPGTATAPLKTINRAAQLAKAGERIRIHAGTYRELIEPLNGGTSASQMILYEAAPGETVIIKGSKILNQPWVQRSIYTDILPDSTLQFTWSKKIWMTTLPDSLFEENYYPFKLKNILDEEYALMPWAELVRNRPPYTSTRGMLWQDGRRLTQVESYGDLARMPGSFWVDTDGETVHMHAHDSINPNVAVFEVGIQSHLFRPQQLGLGFIHLRGLNFQHCPNGFLRTSTGAVTTRGGHHWIIEDNDISEVNSAALEFGYYAFEFRDPTPENIQPRPDEDLGGVIVRNNRIHNAGTAGIRSYTVTKGIIENNRIWDIGWQDAQNYWECSGIKMLRTRNTVVRGNHIYSITGGNGIWMDWDIQGSRVTGNLIHDIQTLQGGIFVEAAQVTNLVDNNIIWNIDGSGIYANDSDSTLIYHNLIANTTGPVVEARVATQRQLSGRWLTANHNRVFNNLFVNGDIPIQFESDSNVTGYNLYVSTREPRFIDLTTLQQSGQEMSSHAMRATMEYNLDAQALTWDAPATLPTVPALPEVSRDFFLHERNDQEVKPGPFISLPQHAIILMNEGILEKKP